MGEVRAENQRLLSKEHFDSDTIRERQVTQNTLSRFILQVARLLRSIVTCSLSALAFGVGHFVVSAELYCGIINQDSTLVVCSNGRCYFTSLEYSG